MESHSYPSFAQAGEDRVLYYFFESTRHPGGLSYMDVGAAAPAGHNNTYLFYTLGGRGVLIEADPKFLPAYREVRPEDRCDQVAVVPAVMALQQYVTFYSMEDSGWSTVLEARSRLAASTGKCNALATFTIPCFTLNQLLRRHFPDQNLDILSIDIPGVNYEVLGELDFASFRPTTILIENHDNPDIPRLVRDSCLQRLSAAGYELLASTVVNSIFATSESIRLMLT